MLQPPVRIHPFLPLTDSIGSSTDDTVGLEDDRKTTGGKQDFAEDQSGIRLSIDTSFDPDALNRYISLAALCLLKRRGGIFDRIDLQSESTLNGLLKRPPCRCGLYLAVAF